MSHSGPLLGRPTSNYPAAPVLGAVPNTPRGGPYGPPTRRRSISTTASSRSPTPTRSFPLMVNSNRRISPTSSSAFGLTWLEATALFALLLLPACVIWRQASTENNEPDPTTTSCSSTAASPILIQSPESGRKRLPQLLLAPRRTPPGPAHRSQRELRRAIHAQENRGADAPQRGRGRPPAALSPRISQTSSGHPLAGPIPHGHAPRLPRHRRSPRVHPSDLQKTHQKQIPGPRGNIRIPGLSSRAAL